MKDIYNSDILTIADAAKRSTKEGFGIPQNFIRKLVKEGTIQAVQAGRKNLLYYPNLIEHSTGRPYQKPTCGTQVNTQKGEEDES